MPYDKKADEVFGTFPEYARKGKMSQDGRMAAIAIVNDMIVVTENIQHFARIPGVRYTDWTAETPEVMTGVADTPAPTQQQKRQQRREERRQGRRP